MSFLTFASFLYLRSDYIKLMQLEYSGAGCCWERDA